MNVTKMFPLAIEQVLISNEFCSKVVKLVREDKKIKLLESDQAVSPLTTLDAV